MKRRRRITAVRVNTKLIWDVALASLIVQKAPRLISMVVPLDPMINRVAGVGAGWLTGMLSKRPDIANASLALGVIELASPFIDQLFGDGGITGLLPEPAPASSEDLIRRKASTTTGKAKSFSDFVNLNDYISNPSVVQPYNVYKDSY